MADLSPVPDAKGNIGRESTYEGTPHWVKVLSIAVIVLVVLFAISHLAGGGLAGHTP